MYDMYTSLITCVIVSVVAPSLYSPFFISLYTSMLFVPAPANYATPSNNFETSAVVHLGARVTKVYAAATIYSTDFTSLHLYFALLYL